MEDLIEVIDVAETVRLAKQIKSLGKEYEYKPLYLWGRDLEIYADRFDIDKIISLLKQFPDLMDELKKFLLKTKDISRVKKYFMEKLKNNTKF